MEKTIEETQEYIGMWVTEDGYASDGILYHGGMILYKENLVY